MQFTLEKTIKLPSGKEFLEGAKLSVEIKKENPRRAYIYTEDGAPAFYMKSQGLYTLSEKFTKPNFEEIEESYLERGVVISLAGEDVEMDGYDEHGMPSMGLVLGLA